MIDRIYFVGAQSTGKTTMARFVRDEYGLPLVTEVVRQLKAEMEAGSLDKIRSDLGVVDAFQSAIFRRQLAAESSHAAARQAFVSDRGFDFLAYTAAHARCTNTLATDVDLARYLAALRQPEALVFFVRPHKELVTADTDRSVLDLRWDEVCRIDGMLMFALELYAIPHVPVASLSMRERVRLVERVLALGGVVKSPQNGSAAVPAVS